MTNRATGTPRRKDREGWAVCAGARRRVALTTGRRTPGPAPFAPRRRPTVQLTDGRVNSALNKES